LSLSPDGKHIALIGTDPKAVTAVYLYQIGIKSRKKVVELHVLQLDQAPQPVWSLDSQYLAGSVTSPNQKPQLYWVDVATAAVHIITIDPTHAYRLVVWSPDSQSFVSCYREGSGSSLTGQLIHIPRTPDPKVVVLLDKPICPVAWIP
jgi:Tol biopolymer transport system component